MADHEDRKPGKTTAGRKRGILRRGKAVAPSTPDQAEAALAQSEAEEQGAGSAPSDLAAWLEGRRRPRSKAEVQRAALRQLSSVFMTEPQAVPSRRTQDDQRDPALLAAEILLRRALRQTGAGVAKVGADGTVCLVTLPSPEWRELVRDGWRRLVRRGERYIEGHARFNPNGQGWAAWLPEQPPTPADLVWRDETFARHVSAGRHCVGIAADLQWLPADFADAADHRLVISQLTGASVGSLARRLCGNRPAATSMLGDEDAALVTPRLLLLARRPGQSAEDYLDRLRALLVHRRPPAARAGRSTSLRAEPTLDRLHGMSQAVAWGRQFARDLNAYRLGDIGADDLDRGCLLSGPPGCGKNLFARALAATCGVPLVAGSYGRWLGSGSGHMGTMLRAMRASFAEAQRDAPSILFIDEIDSFPDRASMPAGSESKDWHVQIVNALLEEIDGNEGRPGVLLLGACNHPETLDPALVRSGRLDRHIRIGMPDIPALEGILREHLMGALADASLSRLALKAAGMSGADCEQWVRNARRGARTAGREVTLADFDEGSDAPAAMAGTQSGTVLQGSVQAHVWRAAVHEAGHAIALCELAPGALQAVVLRMHLGEGGSTLSDSSGGFLLASDVRRRLLCLLSGRAAEEALLHHPSSGAGGGRDSDLAQATRLALCAAAAFGLDADMGLTWWGDPADTACIRLLRDHPPLAARVGEVLEESYADALALVSACLPAVEAVATRLTERCALTGAEVAAIMAGCGTGTRKGLGSGRTKGSDRPGAPPRVRPDAPSS